MGTSISIPCDPCINKVFCWLEKKLGYTRNLGRNLVALETTIEELKAKRDDLTRKATREEDSGLQRLAEFQLWLNRVVNVEAKVNDLLIAREVQLQRLCLCGFCSKNLGSSYGKKVVLVLREVEELKTRVFDVVADQARTHVVDVNQLQPIIADQARTHVVNERQLQPIIVGQETMLEKAWKHLMEDRVGIMGMYGMGGVGKTTLLSQINNKFGNDRCRFDFVIWIVVSKELHVEKVQDEIAHKVGLGREEWKQIYKSQKTDHLFNFLKQKRFVLFLDDIWEKVDLAEIGVPFPTTQNKCKVAFTSRSRDVCSRMGVEDPMEVQCLADSEAFDLFQKKVGHITLGSDPGIPDLARIVAKKCSGLPLALNVIGETMSSKRTIQEWKRAIDVLNSYALQFSGMKDKILPLLKYSYDSLEGDQLKLCLLYCALYPEDYKIPKEDLIEYWICEGIIDGSEGIEKAENEGYDIIGSLVCQSLLMEEVIQNGKGIVSMHDVVREMALWIATDLGEQKEAFIVHADVGLYEIPKVKNWNVVRRMSLMENKISHIADSPECLELTTLLLQEGSLSKISCEFFKYMPKLVVLDLSGNQKLSTLPNGISNLVSLQYLNLSGTDIHHLPKGLQELRKLIHLELEDTPELHSIAGISSQQNLKVLKLYGSGIRWNFSTLDELEALEYLEILTITIYGRQGNHFLRSDRLMSCTQSLRISSSNLKSSRQAMDKLRELRILRCSISKIKMCSFLSLVTVIIKDCKYLTELTFLIFAPNLRYMSVRSSHQLVDIISKEKARQVENSRILPFSKLSYLRLHWLPELKNIYWSPLPFPCLETIEVFNCPKLKKLPFHSKSGKQGDNRLFISYGEREWIKGVEWEDGATKTRFLSSYQQTRYIPPYFPDYDDDY